MPALREDSTLSSSQCQDGPTPQAAPDYFSEAWQEWSNSACQLHLPKARRSQLTAALAQPSSDTGTPVLKLKLEVLGPCPWL